MQEPMAFLIERKAISLALIDDDPVVEIIMRKQIRRLGLESKAKMQRFKNGPAALAYFKQAISTGSPLPDVIMLDLNMPMLSGWEVLDELCRYPDEERPLIYIISSSINPEDQHKAFLRPEVNGFLSKPIHQETLIHVFQQLA